MKKILLLFCLSLLSLSTLHAEIIWSLSNDGTLTISGTDMPNYGYPDYSPWYSQKEKIKKVEIKNGVTNFGNYAFNGCSNLTSITIPNSVTSIGESAFQYCRGLTSITIPNSVTSIGKYAFYFCTGLTSITIPNSVTSIGDDAFFDCIGLTSITIPNSVTSIEHGTFYGCSSLTSITIPNSVTSIGDRAFAYCIGLTSITIPNSVTSIGDRAFEGCSGLTSITIPNSVTSIGKQAFYDCTGLTSITIPNSVTSIGDYAFCNCGSLMSIETLSSTPQSISSKTFTEYGTLHVLPGCKEVYQNADYWKNFTIVEDATDPNKTIYYTSKDGKIVTLSQLNEWGFNANIVSNTYENGQGVITFSKDITSIGRYAFDGCSSLTSIEIPNSVTSIGYSAFRGCSSLTSIQIPNSITSIGQYAFSNCTSLTSIEIPNSVTNIGEWAFEKCISLTSMQIPNSITCIEQYTFYNCTSLTSIEIPSSVTSIGLSAFENCKSLTSIDIPNSVTSIGYKAFEYCRSLTSIQIPNSITSIGQYTFSDCTSLTLIEIPNSVTSIERKAFGYCSSLTSIQIPNSITSIGDFLFDGCSTLTSIEIPNSVTSIGMYAFRDCSSLTSIEIPNSVTSIGDNAFNNCYNLNSVTCLATTPPNIDYYTFYKYGTLHVLPGCKSTYEKTNYWKYFTIVEDAIDPFAPIELADGKTYNEATTQENKEISYTRAFNNTKWQSLYIPFSMTFDDWKDDFEVAYINGIRQMDTDDDGAIDETIMDVVKIKSGSLIPNTPYLIKAKSTGNKTITVNNATLYKAESNSVDCSTTIAKYTFTGTYSTIPAATLLANNYYAMGGGSLNMTDGTSDLKPFRWYLNVESRSPMYNVNSGAKAITINVVGEEEATGISQMTSDREPSSAIYDLNGRKMSQKTLKSGLYIKNGKKIIIK